jgi:hypothetical protein
MTLFNVIAYGDTWGTTYDIKKEKEKDENGNDVYTYENVGTKENIKSTTTTTEEGKTVTSHYSGTHNVTMLDTDGNLDNGYEKAFVQGSFLGTIWRGAVQTLVSMLLALALFGKEDFSEAEGADGKTRDKDERAKQFWTCSLIFLGSVLTQGIFASIAGMFKTSDLAAIGTKDYENQQKAGGKTDGEDKQSIGSIFLNVTGNAFQEFASNLVGDWVGTAPTGGKFANLSSFGTYVESMQKMGGITLDTVLKAQEKREELEEKREEAKEQMGGYNAPEEWYAWGWDDSMAIPDDLKDDAEKTDEDMAQEAGLQFLIMAEDNRVGFWVDNFSQVAAMSAITNFKNSFEYVASAISHDSGYIKFYRDFLGFTFRPIAKDGSFLGKNYIQLKRKTIGEDFDPEKEATELVAKIEEAKEKGDIEADGTLLTIEMEADVDSAEDVDALVSFMTLVGEKLSGTAEESEGEKGDVLITAKVFSSKTQEEGGTESLIAGYGSGDIKLVAGYGAGSQQTSDFMVVPRQHILIGANSADSANYISYNLVGAGNKGRGWVQTDTATGDVYEGFLSYNPYTGQYSYDGRAFTVEEANKLGLDPSIMKIIAKKEEGDKSGGAEVDLFGEGFTKSKELSIMETSPSESENFGGEAQTGYNRLVALGFGDLGFAIYDKDAGTDGQVDGGGSVYRRVLQGGVEGWRARADARAEYADQMREAKIKRIINWLVPFVDIWGEGEIPNPEKVVSPDKMIEETVSAMPLTQKQRQGQAEAKFKAAQSTAIRVKNAMLEKIKELDAQKDADQITEEAYTTEVAKLNASIAKIDELLNVDPEQGVYDTLATVPVYAGSSKHRYMQLFEAGVFLGNAETNKLIGESTTSYAKYENGIIQGGVVGWVLGDGIVKNQGEGTSLVGKAENVRAVMKQLGLDNFINMSEEEKKQVTDKLIAALTEQGQDGLLASVKIGFEGGALVADSQFEGEGETDPGTKLKKRMSAADVELLKALIATAALTSGLSEEERIKAVEELSVALNDIQNMGDLEARLMDMTTQDNPIKDFLINALENTYAGSPTKNVTINAMNKSMTEDGWDQYTAKMEAGTKLKARAEAIISVIEEVGLGDVLGLSEEEKKTKGAELIAALQQAGLLDKDQKVPDLFDATTLQSMKLALGTMLSGGVADAIVADMLNQQIISTLVNAFTGGLSEEDKKKAAVSLQGVETIAALKDEVVNFATKEPLADVIRASEIDDLVFSYHGALDDAGNVRSDFAFNLDAYNPAATLKSQANVFLPGIGLAQILISAFGGELSEEETSSIVQNMAKVFINGLSEVDKKKAVSAFKDVQTFDELKNAIMGLSSGVRKITLDEKLSPVDPGSGLMVRSISQGGQLSLMNLLQGDVFSSKLKARADTLMSIIESVGLNDLANLSSEEKKAKRSQLVTALKNAGLLEGEGNVSLFDPTVLNALVAFGFMSPEAVDAIASGVMDTEMTNLLVNAVVSSGLTERDSEKAVVAVKGVKTIEELKAATEGFSGFEGTSSFIAKAIYGVDSRTTEELPNGQTREIANISGGVFSTIAAKSEDARLSNVVSLITSNKVSNEELEAAYKADLPIIKGDNLNDEQIKINERNALVNSLVDQMEAMGISLKDFQEAVKIGGPLAAQQLSTITVDTKKQALAVALDTIKAEKITADELKSAYEGKASSKDNNGVEQKESSRTKLIKAIVSDLRDVGATFADVAGLLQVAEGQDLNQSIDAKAQELFTRDSSVFKAAGLMTSGRSFINQEGQLQFSDASVLGDYIRLRQAGGQGGTEQPEGSVVRSKVLVGGVADLYTADIGGAQFLKDTSSGVFEMSPFVIRMDEFVARNPKVAVYGDEWGAHLANDKIEVKNMVLKISEKDGIKAIDHYLTGQEGQMRYTGDTHLADIIKISKKDLVNDEKLQQAVKYLGLTIPEEGDFSLEQKVQIQGYLDGYRVSISSKSGDLGSEEWASKVPADEILQKFLGGSGMLTDMPVVTQSVIKYGGNGVETIIEQKEIKFEYSDDAASKKSRLSIDEDGSLRVVLASPYSMLKTEMKVDGETGVPYIEKMNEKDPVYLLARIPGLGNEVLAPNNPGEQNDKKTVSSYDVMLTNIIKVGAAEYAGQMMDVYAGNINGDIETETYTAKGKDGAVKETYAAPLPADKNDRYRRISFLAMPFLYGNFGTKDNPVGMNQSLHSFYIENNVSDMVAGAAAAYSTQDPTEKGPGTVSMNSRQRILSRAGLLPINRILSSNGTIVSRFLGNGALTIIDGVVSTVDGSQTYLIAESVPGVARDLKKGEEFQLDVLESSDDRDGMKQSYAYDYKVTDTWEQIGFEEGGRQEYVAAHRYTGRTNDETNRGKILVLGAASGLMTAKGKEKGIPEYLKLNKNGATVYGDFEIFADEQTPAWVREHYRDVGGVVTFQWAADGDIASSRMKASEGDMFVEENIFSVYNIDKSLAEAVESLGGLESLDARDADKIVAALKKAGVKGVTKQGLQLVMRGNSAGIEAKLKKAGIKVEEGSASAPALTGSGLYESATVYYDSVLKGFKHRATDFVVDGKNIESGHVFALGQPMADGTYIMTGATHIPGVAGSYYAIGPSSKKAGLPTHFYYYDPEQGREYKADGKLYKSPDAKGFVGITISPDGQKEGVNTESMYMQVGADASVGLGRSYMRGLFDLAARQSQFDRTKLITAEEAAIIEQGLEKGLGDYANLTDAQKKSILDFLNGKPGDDFAISFYRKIITMAEDAEVEASGQNWPEMQKRSQSKDPTFKSAFAQKFFGSLSPQAKKELLFSAWKKEEERQIPLFLSKGEYKENFGSNGFSRWFNKMMLYQAQGQEAQSAAYTGDLLESMDVERTKTIVRGLSPEGRAEVNNFVIKTILAPEYTSLWNGKGEVLKVKTDAAGNPVREGGELVVDPINGTPMTVYHIDNVLYGAQKQTAYVDAAFEGEMRFIKDGTWGPANLTFGVGVKDGVPVFLAKIIGGSVKGTPAVFLTDESGPTGGLLKNRFVKTAEIGETLKFGPTGAWAFNLISGEAILPSDYGTLAKIGKGDPSVLITGYEHFDSRIAQLFGTKKLDQKALQQLSPAELIKVMSQFSQTTLVSDLFTPKEVGKDNKYVGSILAQFGGTSSLALETAGFFQLASTLGAAQTNIVASDDVVKQALYGLILEQNYGNGQAYFFQENKQGAIIMPTTPLANQLIGELKKQEKIGVIAQSEQGMVFIVSQEDFDKGAKKKGGITGWRTASYNPGKGIIVRDVNTGKFALIDADDAMTNTDFYINGKINNYGFVRGGKNSVLGELQVRIKALTWEEKKAVAEGGNSSMVEMTVNGQTKLVNQEEVQVLVTFKDGRQDWVKLSHAIYLDPSANYEDYPEVETATISDANGNTYKRRVRYERAKELTVAAEVYEGKDAEGNPIVRQIKCPYEIYKGGHEYKGEEGEKLWKGEDSVSAISFNSAGIAGWDDYVVRVKTGDNTYSFIRVDNKYADKPVDGKIGDRSFWNSSIQSYGYYDGFWQMFTGNYAVDDAGAMGMRDGKVYFANFDNESDGILGLLAKDEVVDKDGTVLMPAGIASQNSHARQMYRTGEALQTAANIQGTLDAVTGIITVVTIPLTFGGSSALTASVGKIASQVATKEISKRAAAWAITKAVASYVGKSVAKTYFTKGVLVSWGLGEALAFAQSGEINVGQSAKNLLLLGGLARGLGFVGSLAKGATMAEAMTAGSIGTGTGVGGFKSLMIKEAIAVGVPNAISIMQGNGLLAPETNMVLAALGFFSPGGASIANVGKNISTAARLGAMSLSAGLGFVYWGGASIASLGAFHGNTQPGWDVIKSVPSNFLMGFGFGGAFGLAGMGFAKAGQSAFFSNFSTNFPRVYKFLSNPITVNAGVATAGAVGLPTIRGVLKTFEARTVADKNLMDNIGSEFTLANMVTGAFIALAYRGLVGKGLTSKGPLLKAPAASTVEQSALAAQKAGHTAKYGMDAVSIKYGLQKIGIGAGIGASAKVLNTAIKDISGEDVKWQQYGLDVLSGGALGALTVAFMVQPKNITGTAKGSPGYYWANPEELYAAIEQGAAKWVYVSPTFETMGAFWKGVSARIENAILGEDSRYAKQTGKEMPWFAVENVDEEGKFKNENKKLISVFRDDRGRFTPDRLIDASLQGPQSGLWMAPLFGAIQTQGLNGGLAQRGWQKALAVVQNPFSASPTLMSLAEGKVGMVLSTLYRDALYMPGLVTGLKEVASFSNQAAKAWTGEDSVVVFDAAEASGFGWLGMLALPTYTLLPKPVTKLSSSDETKKEVMELSGKTEADITALSKGEAGDGKGSSSPVAYTKDGTPIYLVENADVVKKGRNVIAYQHNAGADGKSIIVAVYSGSAEAALGQISKQISAYNAAQFNSAGVKSGKKHGFSPADISSRFIRGRLANLYSKFGEVLVNGETPEGGIVSKILGKFVGKGAKAEADTLIGKYDTLKGRTAAQILFGYSAKRGAESAQKIAELYSSIYYANADFRTKAINESGLTAGEKRVLGAMLSSHDRQMSTISSVKSTSSFLNTKKSAALQSVLRAMLALNDQITNPANPYGSKKGFEGKTEQVAVMILAEKAGRMLGGEVSLGKTLATIDGILQDVESGRISSSKGKKGADGNAVIEYILREDLIERLNIEAAQGTLDIFKGKLLVQGGKNKGKQVKVKVKVFEPPKEGAANPEQYKDLADVSAKYSFADAGPVKEGDIVLAILGPRAFQHRELGMKYHFKGAPKKGMFGAGEGMQWTRVKAYADDIDRLVAEPGMRYAGRMNMSALKDQGFSDQALNDLATMMLNLYQRYEAAKGGKKGGNKEETAIGEAMDPALKLLDPSSRKILQTAQIQQLYGQLIREFYDSVSGPNGKTKLVANKKTQLLEKLLNISSEYRDFSKAMGKRQDAALLYLTQSWAQATSGTEDTPGLYKTGRDVFSAFIDRQVTDWGEGLILNMGGGGLRNPGTMPGHKGLEIMLTIRMLLESNPEHQSAELKAYVADLQSRGVTPKSIKAEAGLQYVVNAMASTSQYDMSLGEALRGKAGGVKPGKYLVGLTGTPRSAKIGFSELGLLSAIVSQRAPLRIGAQEGQVARADVVALTGKQPGKGWEGIFTNKNLNDSQLYFVANATAAIKASSLPDNVKLKLISLAEKTTTLTLAGKTEGVVGSLKQKIQYVVDVAKGRIKINGQDRSGSRVILLSPSGDPEAAMIRKTFENMPGVEIIGVGYGVEKASRDQVIRNVTERIKGMTKDENKVFLVVIAGELSGSNLMPITKDLSNAVSMRSRFLRISEVRPPCFSLSAVRVCLGTLAVV